MPVALSKNDGTAPPPRVLIGGVGYRNLRDHSVGPIMAERLALLSWPAGTEVDDLSFGPIALVQRLQEAPPYDRMVLVASVARGRVPGQVYRYRWPGALPEAEEIQARVGEAVTGVISLDNLLVIGGYFGVLPDDVVLVEVEPAVEDWGIDFTPAVEAALDQVETLVREAALAPIVRAHTRRRDDWLQAPQPAGRE